MTHTGASRHRRVKRKRQLKRRKNSFTRHCRSGRRSSNSSSNLHLHRSLFSSEPSSDSGLIFTNVVRTYVPALSTRPLCCAGFCRLCRHESVCSRCEMQSRKTASLFLISTVTDFSCAMTLRYHSWRQSWGWGIVTQDFGIEGSWGSWCLHEILLCTGI